MGYKLLHIYGPVAIHAYGLFISLGILVFSYLLNRDNKFIHLNLSTKFPAILLISIIAGFFGGRIFSIVEEPNLFDYNLEWFAFWEGGFSILGSILGILFINTWYFKKSNIPILPFSDRAVIYIPLLQSIARIGCFFAGCCCGIETKVPWGIIYTDPNTIAPLHSSLHPTQLYSALLLFFIFLFMYYFLQKILGQPGQLLTAYLILISIERFFIDFWRIDRMFLYQSLLFSFSQLLAIVIFTGASISFFLLSYQKTTMKNS